MPDAKGATHLAYYLVLYEDVLGQKERLHALTELPGTAEEYEVAVKVVADTAGFVKKWRGLYESFFTAFMEHESPHLAALPPEVRDSVRIARKECLQFRHFSDSTIATVCLHDDGQESLRPISGVLTALLGACAVHVLSPVVGKAIRGGVDIGVGIPFPDGELYGPALARAAYLESTVAGYPRVVVGRELIKYLEATSLAPPKSKVGLVRQALAQRCRGLIIPDYDGEPSLDYLGKGFREFGGGKGDGLEEGLLKAYKFVWEEKERLRKEGNKKLAERYEHWWAYMKSRAELWGASVSLFSSRG